jgi:hypothetical protein
LGEGYSLRFVKRKLLYGEIKALVPGYPICGVLAVLFLAALLCPPCSAFVNWSPLIDRLVADGFDEVATRALFSRPEVKFEPSPMITKLEELIKRTDQKQSGPLSYNPKVVY